MSTVYKIDIVRFPSHTGTSFGSTETLSVSTAFSDAWDILKDCIEECYDSNSEKIINPARLILFTVWEDGYLNGEVKWVSSHDFPPSETLEDFHEKSFCADKKIKVFRKLRGV